MAENEGLDFGHPHRWRRSRAVLRDGGSSLSEFIETADDDCAGAVRLMARSLQKEPLTILLLASKGSIVERQAAVAAYSQKRLASVFEAALRENPGRQPDRLAVSASRQMVRILIDQIMGRAQAEQRFCSPRNQAALRTALTEKFSRHIAPIQEAIERSLRGMPSKRLKTHLTTIRRASPQEVVAMSLVSRPPSEQRRVQ